MLNKENIFNCNIDKYIYHETDCGILLNDDNIKCCSMINDNSIDLTVTSPPYDNLRDYKGYIFDFENLAKELFRITKDGGVVVWVVGDATINGSESLTSFKQAIYFVENCGFKLHDTMIYKKDSNPFQNPHRYMQSFEYMFVLTKNNIKTFNLIKEKSKNFSLVDRYKTFREKNGNLSRKFVKHNEFKIKQNVWDINCGYMRNSKDIVSYKHPAIFPEQLAKDHIISWSNESDVVFDPFSGSGTTWKMAEKLNRKFIGCEIAAEYCEIGKQRIMNLDKYKFAGELL